MDTTPALIGWNEPKPKQPKRTTIKKILRDVLKRIRSNRNKAAK